MKRLCYYCTIAAATLMTILPAFTLENNALNAEEPPDFNDISLTDSQRELLEDNNDFACNLFRTIYAKSPKQESIIMSPISVSYLLGMLNEGAAGATRKQITDLIGPKHSAKDFNLFFKKMIEEAPNVDSKVTVKMANLVIANSAKNISIVPKYKGNMQTYYNAQIESLNFNSARSLDRINNWCEQKTDGMIPKILDNLNPETAMCLLNAVYFKAKWTNKFKPEKTRKKDFTKQDGTIVKRWMMQDVITTCYGENDLYKILRLSYGDKGYSMYLLLPHSGKTLDDIIKGLSAKELKQIRLRKISYQLVDIQIPRFNATNQIDLKDVLSSMGMSLAFDPRRAEFPNMAQNEELWVSMMKQMAKIEVDEEGTKAAVVTYGMTRNRSASIINNKIFEFHATRPFIYFIAEESTGAIFFMGTYCGD